MLIAYISFQFWLFTESIGIFKATTDFKSNSKNILYNYSIKDGLLCFSDQPPSTPRPVHALRKMVAEDPYRLEYQRSQGNVAEIFYWGLGGRNLSWKAAHWVHCSNLTEYSCRNVCSGDFSLQLVPEWLMIKSTFSLELLHSVLRRSESRNLLKYHTQINSYNQEQLPLRKAVWSEYGTLRLLQEICFSFDRKSDET